MIVVLMVRQTSCILEVQGSNLVCTPLYELKGHWALGLFAKCMCNVAHPWFIRLNRFHTVAENRHNIASRELIALIGRITRRIKEGRESRTREVTGLECL